MTIIGICGFQSAGKDTLAEYLINNYGFVKLSYAGALKDIISIIFGWDRVKLEGISKEDREWREHIDEWWATQLGMPQLTPRYVLQYFGTDLFRTYWHKDIWVKVVENQLTKYKNIVITDCRFPNEIDLIKKYNGHIIHIYRKELPIWFEKYKNGEDVEEIKKLIETYGQTHKMIFELVTDGKKLKYDFDTKSVKEKVLDPNTIVSKLFVLEKKNKRANNNTVKRIFMKMCIIAIYE